MKNRKAVIFILLFLLILSLGCSLLDFGKDEPAAVEEAAPAEAVEPAEVAEAEEPEEPEPTPVPPTEAPPTEVPPTEPPPPPEATPIPSWRMPAPDGAILVVTDADNNADWEDIASMHAATLAIPAPFYYELYVLPAGIKFPAVETHYTTEMSARKYKPARNEQGANQMYLLTYLYSLDKSSKNAVLFYAELSNRDPMALVIYSKPVE